MKSRERKLMKFGLGAILTAGLFEACAPRNTATTELPVPSITETVGFPTPTETLVVTKTPEPSITPTIPLEIRESTPEAYIQSTIQAVIQSGERTTFAPEGVFTQELYDTAMKSVYPIAVMNGLGNQNMGTAFVVAKEGNVLYLMTSTHVIEEHNEGRDLVAFIPLGNHKIVGFRDQSYVSYESRDIAIIKATVSEEFAEDVASISFIENYEFHRGEQALIIGWPRDFYVGDQIFTSAFITSIDAVSSDAISWKALGLVNYGSSGSPLIIADSEGRPVVVAAVTKKSDDVTYPDGTFTVTRFVKGYTLVITPLLNNLK